MSQLCAMGVALGVALKLVDDIYDESLLGGPGSHPSMLVQAVFVAVYVALAHAHPAWALCGVVSCMACSLAGQMDEWVYLAVYTIAILTTWGWAWRGAYLYGRRELGYVLLSCAGLLGFVLWEQRAFDDRAPTDEAYRCRKFRWRTGFAAGGLVWAALLAQNWELLQHYLPRSAGAVPSMVLASTGYMATSALLLCVRP